MQIHGFITLLPDFEIKNISGSNIVLFTGDIDKSSLKIGDNIEVLFQNEETKVATGIVANIDKPTKTINNNLIKSKYYTITRS